MNLSDRKIYIQETEIKPNRYASYVLVVTFFTILACWLLNEIGIFRVGKLEMRIGSGITLIATMVPLSLLFFRKGSLADPRMKFVVIVSAALFTFSGALFLTFHTTIMLLFPILFAMLYRSKTLGVVATVSSFVCTVAAPILGYLMGTWDIPLFEELILIATNGGVVTVTGGSDTPSWLNVGKIILYLTLPRLMMIGSSAVLLFNNIRLGVDHVNKQILLDRISHMDSMTGLYNQNFFQEFVGSVKQRKPVTQIGVLFFDVNGLKEINDSLGHEYGDILLKRCAASLEMFCNDEMNACFRVGGDEFLVFAEGATEAVLNQMVSEWEDRLVKINEENRLLFKGLVCSMAVGYQQGKSDAVDEVVRAADAFMYRNKARMKEGKRLS